MKADDKNVLEYLEVLQACKGALGLHADIEDRDKRDQWVLRTARKCFEKDGELARTLIFRTRTQPAQLVVFVNNLPPELAHMGGSIGRAAAKHFHAQQMYLVMEMWYAQLESVPEGMAPRHSPQRREGLMVVAEDPYRSPPCVSWTAEITRDAQGKGTAAPWTHSLDAREGRLMYMLPPEAYLVAGRKVPEA